MNNTNKISVNKEISIYSSLSKVDIVETMYTIFYISIGKDNIKSVNYARLNSEILTNSLSKTKNSDIYFFDKKRSIVHKYFSIGHSIDARAGEFYPHIVNFKSINLCKNMFKFIWDILDLHIRNMVSKHKIDIFNETQYPTTKIKKMENNIKDSIFNNGIEIDMLIINFYICIFIMLYKIDITNINKTYKYIFYDYLKLDISNIAYEFKKFSKKELVKMYYYCTHFILSENEFTHIGQKLLPLYLNEVKMPFNFYFNSWKDLIIISNVSDLVVNDISISFPLYSCWFYMRNINKLIFNGDFLRVRIKNSVEILNIINHLKNAKNKLRLMINNDVNNSEIENILKNIIISKNENLDNKINSSLEYIKNNLLISEVILCINVENCGITLKLDLKLDNKKSFMLGSNYQIFSKYIFEIIYSIMCLHKKLNIVHSDLHLKNVLINKKRNNPDENIIYKIDKNNIYSFSLSKGNIVFIDFDQSVIEFSQTQKEQLIKNIKIDYISYNEINTKDYYTLINKFTTFFNLTNKYKTMIGKYAFIHNKEFINYMTVFDLLSLISQIKKFIKNTTKLKLLNDITKYCNNILTNNFVKSLENEDYNKYDSGKNFLLDLIKKLFKNYKITRKKKNKKDIYINLENKITYSTTKFPLMKKEWTNKNSKLYFDETKKKYKVVDPIIPNRHTEKYI